MYISLKKIFLVFLCGFYSAVSMAWAQDVDAEKIEIIERRGLEIYSQDIAAWTSTDKFFTKKKLQAKYKGKFRGWLSYPEGKQYKTVFIVNIDDDPKVVFEVITLKKRVKSSKEHKEPRDFTEEEARQWQVRTLMLEQKIEICPQFTPMNTVIIPVSENFEDGYLGYLFSASKQHDEIVLGKHYRFHINSDASEVIDTHSFTHTCFAINLLRGPNGEKPAALMASHLMAPHPEETHVFANLAHKIDFYIATEPDGTIWRVSNGKITKLDR